MRNFGLFFPNNGAETLKANPDSGCGRDPDTV